MAGGSPVLPLWSRMTATWSWTCSSGSMVRRSTETESPPGAATDLARTGSSGNVDSLGSRTSRVTLPSGTLTMPTA